MVVGVVKPALRVPYETGELNKETFKQVVKKTADKVLAGYRKEGLTPPSGEELAPSQRLKIEKLAVEYIKVVNGR